MTANAAEILKPISEIANLISNEYLKKIELYEYCKIIESDLNNYQKKIQALASDKNESSKIKAEYKRRNKVNITNSKRPKMTVFVTDGKKESFVHKLSVYLEVRQNNKNPLESDIFRQALNELYRYKAELKSCYLATEKALKLRRIKYKKIISAYDSAWKEAVKKYNSDPVFVELLEIQQENTLLEREIERQQKLSDCLETEFIQLKENIEKTFFKKIVEFSKAVIKYKEFLKSQNRIKENQLVKTHNSERSFEFKLFRENVSPFRKNSFDFDNDEETNITYSVDISIFDDMMVPSENLESQSLEDEGYSFMQNEGELLDVSKDQDEDLEYLNDYQQKMELQNKEAENPRGNLIHRSAKGGMATEENESQYFKQQTLELCTEDVQPSNRQNLTEENFNKQGHVEQKSDNNLNGGGKTLNSINNKSMSSVDQTENEDAVQMECEESVSELSYGNQRETYECQYRKTYSVSSDDLTSNGDNQNESVEPSYKPNGDEQNNCLKARCETEKNDFQSFTGFFTMGNDHEPPTPSIFKLF